MAPATQSTRRGRRASTPPSSEGEGAAPNADAPLANPQKTTEHLFLQALMARRIMTSEVANEIYLHCASICGLEHHDEFVTFCAELEPGLTLCGLEIKTAFDQETGEPTIALVNTISDETAKLATEYKPEEIAFFRIVVERIMTAPDMSYCLSWNDALRCASNSAVTPAITKVAASVLIQSLVAKGWLDVHPKRHLTLSSRSLLELASYLRDTFKTDDDEVDDDDDSNAREQPYVECHSCFSLVTIGSACPNDKCSVRLHKHCAVRVFAVNGKCPTCGENWIPLRSTGGTTYVGTPVGLAAAITGITQSQSDEEEEEEEQTPAQKKKGAKKAKANGSGKGKGKGKAAASDEEDELEDDEDEDEDEDLADLEDALTQSGLDVSPVGREPRSRAAAKQGRDKYVAPNEVEEDDNMEE